MNRSPTTPESVDDKGLEILITATIATLTRKNKQRGLKELVKGSLKKEETSMHILVNWFQIKWKMLKSAEIVIAVMTLLGMITLSTMMILVLERKIWNSSKVHKRASKCQSCLPEKNFSTLNKTEKNMKNKRDFNQLENKNLFLKDDIRRKGKFVIVLLESFSVNLHKPLTNRIYPNRPAN